MELTACAPLFGLMKNSVTAPDWEKSGRKFNPSLHFILSEPGYVEAAQAAIEPHADQAVAHYLCSTGFGGWSLEVELADTKFHGPIADTYDRECDRLRLP